MPQKGQPLAETDSVYRRIPKAFYPGGKTAIPPPWQAFRPSERDTDGLSVFQASLTDPAWLSGPKGGDVGELSVASVRSVRDRDGATPLEVVCDPLEGQPGHALIPAMNAAAYAADKQRVTELAQALAERVTLAFVGPSAASEGRRR